MTIRLGVVMDPIHSIKPYKDTTFAMLLAAQRRGWQLYYMEQQDLWLRDGQAGATMRGLQVQDDASNWFSLQPAIQQPLTELDGVLLRKDPPVDLEYLYTTYILEQAVAAGVCVFNDPQAVRDANEKLYTTWFAQCCVPTLVSRDRALIRDFLTEQQDIIAKPLDNMGGAGIFRLRPNDPNLEALLESLTCFDSRTILVQRYIPEITQGDKRIILINGEPIPYALARLPAPGETRANLAAGGKGVGVALSARDKWICEQVGPVLREKGLLFVGLDVIGDYLTEINVTSPTCVRELEALYGLAICEQWLDVIEQQLKI